MSRGGPHAAWREASRLIRRHRGPLMLALLLVVVNRLAALALPTASKYVVDEVIGRQRTDLVGLIAALVCAAIAIEAVAAFGAVQVAGVAGQRAVVGLRQELQKRIVGLPLWRIDDARSGSLASQVMTDSEQVRFLVGNGSVQLVASMLTAVLALGLLFRLDASLALAVLTVMGLLAIGVRRAFSRISAAFERVCRRQAELTGWLGQVIGGIRVVKACVAERREAHRFVQESHTLAREAVCALREIARLNTGSTLAAGAVGAFVLMAGGRAVAAGTMSLGSLVMFIWLTGFLLAPVMHIAASAGELGKASAALRRIAGLRELATEEQEDRGRCRVQRVVGTVDFEDVRYGYVPERLALRGVSLHAPAGSTTALVGPSGSGKTTLCRLLLAFDYPTSGRILIDGRDLATVRRRDYRAHLGVVLQEDLLFDGTIADNIRYGRPGASWADALAAGRLARCDDFAEPLTDGYGTLVGERGVRLSGGQRQRIAIARAILADPRILVLDEATSSLDSESELLIQSALRTLCQGRTTFVIAHRFSTVRGADHILVVDGGAVVERGTHEALLAQEGRYWHLHQAQHRAERNIIADAGGGAASRDGSVMRNGGHGH
jgi:ATP-binding cassette, subfamily B, putative efflux pump